MVRMLNLLRHILIIFVLIWSGEGATQSQPQANPPELLEKIRISNNECYSCHTAKGVENTSRPDVNITQLKKFLLEQDHFKLSGHGRMECKTCHGAGYAVFPHAVAARSSISQCEECHAAKVMRVEQQFHASVHAKTVGDKFTCTSCHDPHLFNVAAKFSSPKAAAAQDNAMCLDCHESEQRFSAMAPADKRRPDLDRIHSWLPNARQHWSAVRCVDCHTPLAKMQSHEILNKDKALRDCVACHTKDSALRTRLYRHLAQQDQETYGFINAMILSESYVVGATRNRYLDNTIIALAGLTILGLIGHGLVRLWTKMARRNKQ